MSEREQIEQSLGRLAEEFAVKVAQAGTAGELETVRVTYLGRKSPFATYFKQLGTLPAEDRALLGKALNTFKQTVEEGVHARQRDLVSRPTAPALDVTLPGVPPPWGRLHPITQTLDAIIDCFTPLGFDILEGPELEREWNNFDALNIPADHPSRESFDTFFVDAPAPQDAKGAWLLRSHTSPVQIRVMQTRKPPLRIVVPGRVYRPDPLDASHSFMFHQVEGLMVDDRVTFTDLKGVLTHLLIQLFGPSTTTRFRPHYFPFTEPSAEVDIACTSCQGAGCQTCGRKGWLEIMGCGMVHPNVFRAVGYHPTRVQGFAFGMGVERIAMLQHGIKDIRLFFENDPRFLEQF